MLTPRETLGIEPRPPIYALVRYAVVATVMTAALLVPHDFLDAPGASTWIATVPVVVASRDMPEGTIIDRMALMVAQWPAGTQPAGAYTTIDSVTTRVTRVPIYKGEPLVPGRLAPEGTGAGLEVKITPGKRAYGIRINDVASLAGMVQPNSRVDIMVVTSDPEQGKAVAKLFMSNMRVLAIGAAPDRRQDSGPILAAVASIEVTPDEAEKLSIAASQGSLQLVLRGYGDPDSVNTTGAIAQDVLTEIKRRPTVQVKPAPRRRSTTKPPPLVKPPPVVKRPPDTTSMRVYRGTSVGADPTFQKDQKVIRGPPSRP